LTRVNSGIVFEYTVRDYLISLGYTVIRSAGSRSPVDLVAFNKSIAILIQCKKELRGRGYKDDLDSLSGVSAPMSFKKQLWVKRGVDITVHDITRGKSTVYRLKLKDMKVKK
jgi:Holliday junction resolvase